MAFDDLRQYIARLAEEGEVQPIEKEVDWDLELGAIIRRAYDLGAPAPLFQNIKDYPRGYRVLGAPVGSSDKPGRRFARLALALGMKPDAPVRDIIEQYIERKANPVAPVVVSTGPCKENVHLGDEVDLEEFPVPVIHGGDGGRFIGTWHTVITKDPDTGKVNWGMYRLMLHDKKTAGIRINPYQDIGLQYYSKYEARNKPMEFAAAIGTEPVTALISGTRVEGSEAEVVGGMRGEPIELVKCETVDLLVPATSEIVLEGQILPYERKEEGPFGEYFGYTAGERAPRPVCRISAVTHRNDPILPASCMGVPVDDDDVVQILWSAELLDYLRGQGHPVEMAYIPPEVSKSFMVISTKVPFMNYAKHLAAAVWGSKIGRQAHYLIVVEDDIDVTNLGEVMFAVATRCHPDRGIVKMPHTVASGLTPFLTSYEKRNNIGAHVLFDATWPRDWPKDAIPVKSSFDVSWPTTIQEKVLGSWKEYGYTGSVR